MVQDAQGRYWMLGPDSGKLTYTVLYTPNGGKSWYPLEVDTADPQLAIQTSETASGDQIQFRVLASDGLNTAKADSPPIQVRNGIVPESTPQVPGSSSTASGDSSILLLVALGGTAVCGIFGVFLIAGLIVITRPRPRPTHLPQRGALAATPPARLDVARGQTNAQSVDLSRSAAMIGRDPASTLIVNDPAASRQHARVAFENGAWVISDWGSRNGTYVNGARITRQTLRHGDQIQIGQIVIVFQCDAPAHVKPTDLPR